MMKWCDAYCALSFAFSSLLLNIFFGSLSHLSKNKSTKKETSHSSGLDTTSIDVTTDSTTTDESPSTSSPSSSSSTERDEEESGARNNQLDMIALAAIFLLGY